MLDKLLATFPCLHVERASAVTLSSMLAMRHLRCEYDAKLPPVAVLKLAQRMVELQPKAPEFFHFLRQHITNHDHKDPKPTKYCVLHQEMPVVSELIISFRSLGLMENPFIAGTILSFRIPDSHDIRIFLQGTYVEMACYQTLRTALEHEKDCEVLPNVKLYDSKNVLHSEIDVLVRRGKELYFFEVKSGANFDVEQITRLTSLLLRPDHLVLCPQGKDPDEMDGVAFFHRITVTHLAELPAVVARLMNISSAA